VAQKVGIIWDTPVVFTRLVEDCGYLAELVTPRLLAAPFFRRSFSGIIIPGGFAHPSYSSVLPALRACEDRIRRFIISGGRALVFGAGIDRPDAYDWLPGNVVYRFGFSEGRPDEGADPALACITDECPEVVFVDGVFELETRAGSGTAGAPGSGTDTDPRVCLCINGKPVMIEYSAGAGRIILTTLHEYPSRGFLRHFCADIGETLL
jgi:hypothetical protein